MRCERLSAPEGGPPQLAAGLRSLVPGGESVAREVAEIIDGVRNGGDRAVIEYSRQFDSRLAPDALEVEPAQLDVALDALPGPVRAGLERAIENVTRVAQAAVGADQTVELGPGHKVTLRSAPVQRAAVYVPGGRAPYPSTVVMGVATARVAGVPEVVVCAPPRGGGEVDPVVLAAARLAGVRAVYRMGGAHAVAALAHGTETVPAVDVIVGPGNLFVQEAKRQVSGQVGIDGFAGPSDLVLIAGADLGTPERGTLALDLLAQAEHGPGTLVVALSDDADLLGELERALEQAPDTGAIAATAETVDLEHALQIAQAFAPEHLQLAGTAAEALAPRATRAGCVFVGAAAGTAFGDYIAGSNHVLPTGGAARFTSALNPAHFRRSYTVVELDHEAAADLARAAAPVARAEGFELHARSMEARIEDNGPS